MYIPIIFFVLTVKFLSVRYLGGLQRSEVGVSVKFIIVRTHTRAHVRKETNCGVEESVSMKY